MKQGCRAVRLLAAIWVLFTASAAYAQSLPASAVTVLYHFTATDGVGPVGQLVQGPDGALYGVLTAGGTFGQGSVFKLDPKGQFQTLYSFGSSSLPSAAPDGSTPNAGVIFGSDGNLYGTTTQGGPNFGGTVFKMTVTGQLTTLVGFGGPSPAASEPYGPLYFGADGNFYGTTNAGGSGGAGTVFRMTPSGMVTILHNFAGDYSEGGGLFGAMVMATDGTLYGTTSLGGIDPSSGRTGDGTVFKILPDGTFSILHYFPYTATNTIPGLVLAPDGTLYGLTELGGIGTGNAYSITSDGTYIDLHDFGCSCGTPDGSEPVGPLTLGSDGNFYGLTIFGGTVNNGTMFKMTPGGVVTPLHSFTVAEGGGPAGGVVQGTDGRFYGMTSGLYTRDPTIYSFALPPSASPTTLAAVAGDGAVSLSWAAVTGANTYNVYQGTASGAEGATPVSTGITGTSTKVTGLQNGTTYYFQVVAINEAGNGPTSAEVPALPIAAPGNLVATAGNGSVSLSWSAAAGALSYSVYEGTSSGGEGATPIATGVTSTTFAVSGLTNGSAYYFKVASVNGSTVVTSTSEGSATPTAPPSHGGGGGGGGGAIDSSVLSMLLALTLGVCGSRRSRSAPNPRRATAH